MIVGLPFGFTSAMLLPATSEVTVSAKVFASSRQTRAAGPSNPDGPGVSSNRFRNASDEGESTGDACEEWWQAARRPSDWRCLGAVALGHCSSEASVGGSAGCQRRSAGTDSFMILIFVLVGLAAGILAGLFGIGGGIVIVPLLLLGTSMPMLTATGTSLGALLLPVGAVGVWTYYKSGHLDVAAALWIALGLTIGVTLGARFAQSMSPALLRRAFSLLLPASTGR